MKGNRKCKVWGMKKEKGYEMLGECLNLCKVGILEVEKCVMERIEREEGIEWMSGEERYEKVLNKEKWVFKDVGLKEIGR